MKKIYLLSILLYLSFSAFAQITITKNDMPVSRDTARYSTSSTRLNFDTTGAGITWDYSSLVADGQGIDSFKTALSINTIYGLYYGFSTDYGLPNNNLNFGFVNLTNGYNFYKTSTSSLEIKAIGADYNGISLPNNYTTPDKVYQFPLTYGRVDTSAYDVSISVPGTATIHEVGTRINTVDGWGTVITPYGTFQCIRLKSVTSEVDSVTITLLGFTLPTRRNTTTYKWLANGQIIPVLEVSGTISPFTNAFTPNSEKFRDNVRFIPPQFNLTINFTASATTCTTADTVSITPRVRPFNASNTASYQYNISPSTYQFVSSTDSTTRVPKVNFTAPGLYTVSLHASAPAGGSIPATADTTKTDYILVNAPAGIQSLAQGNMVNIFPNPANDHLNLMLNGEAAIHTVIEVMDMCGQVLYSSYSSQQAEIAVPTSRWSAGDYMVRVTGANGTGYMQKISIVH